MKDMAVFKKIVLIVASASLSLLLYGFASLWILHQTALKPAIVKKWAQDSGLYQNIVPAAIEVIDNPKTESTIPFKDLAIVEAGKTAFDDRILRDATEQFIDQVSLWLQSKDGNLTINLDLSAARTKLATQIGTVAATKLQNLPSCGAATPATFDAFSSVCLPKGIDPTKEGDRLANELVSNTSFLGTGVVTNKTLGIPEQTNGAYSTLPKMYQAYTKVLIVTGIVVAAFTLVIIFYSSQRRKGIRRVARIYILTAVLLASTAVLLPYLSRGYAPATTSASDKAFVDKIIRPLINQVEKSAIREHFIIAGLIGSIGASLALYLLLTRTKKKDDIVSEVSERPFSDHPNEPREPTAPSPPAE